MTILANWIHLPVQNGLAELDLQIDKMRALRDSYQVASQKQMSDQISEQTTT